MNNRILLFIAERKWVIEIILTSLALVVFLTGSPESTAVTLSLSLLAGFYFIGALTFPPADDYVFFEVVMTRVGGIACAVCIVGIQLYLMESIGAMEQLMVGVTALIGATLSTAFKFLNTHKRTLLPPLIRMIVVGAVSGWVLITNYDWA